MDTIGEKVYRFKKRSVVFVIARTGFWAEANSVVTPHNDHEKK